MYTNSVSEFFSKKVMTSKPFSNIMTLKNNSFLIKKGYTNNSFKRKTNISRVSCVTIQFYSVYLILFLHYPALFNFNSVIH